MEPDPTLRRLRIAAAVLALLGLAAAGVALWIALDNPTVEATSGGDHPCLAPWDTVLNDASNQPGGEPPPDADRIAARCRAAGEGRFHAATAVGAGAALAAISGAVAGAAARRRDRRPTY